MVSPREIAVRNRLRCDFEHYAKRCLRIKPKEGGELLPFKLNPPQKIIHERLERQKKEKGKVRAIILKGRQQGCSTLIGGRFYWLTTHTKAVKTFILTHEREATKNLFQMTKRFHDNCPALVKPICSEDRADSLNFAKLDSGYSLGTASNRGVGRSFNIQLFHGSEVDFWDNPGEHATGILQAVGDTEGTEIVLESTANGVGSYFHKQWQLAESGLSPFMPIFIAWFLSPEYAKPVEGYLKLNDEDKEYKRIHKLSREQMLWRQDKIAEFTAEGGDGLWRFRQEYPATPQEAFQTSGQNSFLQPQDIEKAKTRENDETDTSGAYIVGVDPARFGNDRTGIIRRKGRNAFKLEFHKGRDQMEIAGICIGILHNEPVDKMFIDSGMGGGVIDRLVELGYGDRVMEVPFGAAPVNKMKYSNKRAEMWGEMADWIKNKGCIPPDNELISDLSSPGYGFDSSGKLKLEKKEDMKKRGLRSPDGADALALTFAFHVSSFEQKQERAINNAVYQDTGSDYNPLYF